MKKILFALGLLLASNAFAATGTGHAQTELTKPLSVREIQPVDFGIIAIDSAGEVELSVYGEITSCPTTYVCAGSPTRGYLGFTGAPNEIFSLSIEGSVAVLADGFGNQVVFDPQLNNVGLDVKSLAIDSAGNRSYGIGGTLTFTGNEIAGTYSSSNAGGSGYQITLNY